MYIQNDFQKCTPYVTEVTGLLSDPLKVIIACRVHQNALNTYSQKRKKIKNIYITKFQWQLTKSPF